MRLVARELRSRGKVDSTQPPTYYPTYLDSIGKTPLVRIDRMLPEAAKHATVLVKLEMQNPGGSIKDQDSIDAANKLGQAMVVTGVRHFKH